MTSYELRVTNDVLRMTKYTLHKNLYGRRALYFCALLFICYLLPLSLNAQTLQEIWTKGTFYPERMFNLKALKHTPQYTVLEYNRDKRAQEINLYDFATLTKVQTLFQTNDRVNRIEGYEFTADEKKLLIATRKEDIYRHSFIADYFLYDLATGDLTGGGIHDFGRPFAQSAVAEGEEANYEIGRASCRERV